MRKAVPLLAFALLFAAPQTLSGAQSSHKRTARRKSTHRTAVAPAKSSPADTAQPTQATQSSTQTTAEQQQQSQQQSQPTQPQSQQPKQQTIPQVRLDDPVVTPRASGKSEDELAAEAFSASLNDALRKPLKGETRRVGTLTQIECAGGGLVFTVEAEGRTLRLTSRGFEGLQIVAYTPQAGTQLTCGPRKLQSRAIVTYRAAPGARDDGSIVALEFVPENFKLRQ
ncbi:MAG TPA: hypothetical protein VLJ61_03630 [Pyrinomonadaceae bacterium]|nr:hypothetical protein [Pyrinomonadaceae bacterium]